MKAGQAKAGYNHNGSPPPQKYRNSIDDWLDSMRSLAGPDMARETIVHIRDEYSTWDWVMTGMLERACFNIDNKVNIMPNMFAYICSK